MRKGGGGRKTVYLYTMEDYNQCILKLKQVNLTPEEKLHWYEVKLEKERYMKNNANKLSVSKKKEIAPEVQTEETPVV
jgi:hypothetical protein